jgi:hypothetical protein
VPRPVRLWSNLGPIVTRIEREPRLFECQRGDALMTKQVRTIGFAAFTAHVLPVGMLLLGGVQSADAKLCSAAMPSNPKGHWTYRLIDGRKCWYEGESKISKSLLQWPASAPIRSAQPRHDEKQSPAETPTVSAKAAPPNSQSLPEQCCRTQLGDSDTFEARWGAVEMTLVRN